MLGLIFSATIFCGINNSSSVIPYITTERNVLYRERFAGMYAPWAYGLAQVTFAYIKFQQINIKTCNKLWMKFVGDNWSSIHLCPITCICDYHISDDRILLVGLQSTVVLLLHLLHIDVLHIYGNDAGFTDSELSASCHYKFLLVHNAKLVLWIYNTPTGKNLRLFGQA